MVKTAEFTGHASVTKLDGHGHTSWYAFTCGYCGTKVSGAVIAMFKPYPHFHVRWLQCTECANASVEDSDGVICPPVKFGPNLEGLPSEISSAYDEARNCISVSAYTSCELTCRKILMHVAVEKGAKEGETFASYISYLETQGFITPPMKPWVDEIRKIGNVAAHRLDPKDRTRSESTLMFTAELLRLVYEMDHLTRRYAKSGETQEGPPTS